MIYLRLFASFFQIGLFSIGGGYAALPLIQNQIVDTNGWLSLAQFVDIITIAEMTPGPIAINSATFVGIQIAGFFGAFVSTLGVITPSIIIVLALAFVYYKYRDLYLVSGVLKGLRPIVVALISSAGISILMLSFFNLGEFPKSFGDVNIISILIFGVGLFFLRKFKLNPIYVLIGSGVLGFIIYSCT